MEGVDMRTKKIYLFFVVGCACLFLYADDVQQKDGSQKEEVDETVIWIGPGWYYGQWFEDEDVFYGYQRDHYYHDDHHHDGHDHHNGGHDHHDGHHGGDHGGGHGGGDHHGGGGHGGGGGHK